MKIEVLTTQWSHDGGTLPGGVHEIEKPTKKLLEQAALAESVGSVKVLASTEERAKMRAAIEPDSESEKKLLKAQANSTWHVGNLSDYIAAKSSLLKEHGDELSDESRASLELGVKQATEILKHLDKGKSYDEAVTAVLNG